MTMPKGLTREEKARRARLVQRIRDWEKVVKVETDPKALEIAQAAVANMKKLLEEGDQA